MPPFFLHICFYFFFSKRKGVVAKDEIRLQQLLFRAALPNHTFAAEVVTPPKTHEAAAEGERKSQSKILPRCHNSLSAHSVPSESCWGVPSPNPAVTAYAAVVPLASAVKIYFLLWLRFLKKMSIER